MEIETIAKLEVQSCTIADYHHIIDHIEDFWGSSRTLPFHHPMFINEFGNTCFVIKEEEIVVAYLFGFLSQTEDSGYVHLVGVRASYQRKGLGRKLYAHFQELLRGKQVKQLKAITTPTNEQSIRFHLGLGMRMVGTVFEQGTHVVKDYSGKGQDRVVFKMIL